MDHPKRPFFCATPVPESARRVDLVHGDRLERRHVDSALGEDRLYPLRRPPDPAPALLGALWVAVLGSPLPPGAEGRSPRPLRSCNRLRGSSFETYHTPGEPLAPRMPVRVLPGAFRPTHPLRRPLNCARSLSPCVHGAAIPAPSQEPRGLRPDDPTDRGRTRDEERPSAPCLDAVPRPGNHARERRDVPEPAPVPQFPRRPRVLGGPVAQGARETRITDRV